MRKSRRAPRWLAIVLLAAFVPLATVGCFGRFQITRNVYKFNKEVSPDKWMQWFVFLILTIIPVYGLATFLDAILLNSIEFWTGENPAMAAGTSRVLVAADGSRATLTLRADRAIDVRIDGPDGTRQRLRLVREAGSVAALDADGRLLARVADVAGAPALVGGALASRVGGEFAAAR